MAVPETPNMQRHMVHNAEVTQLWHSEEQRRRGATKIKQEGRHNGHWNGILHMEREEDKTGKHGRRRTNTEMERDKKLKATLKA